MQLFGMPDHGIMQVKGIAQPQPDTGTIFSQLENAQAAVGLDGLLILKNLITVISSVGVPFYDQQRFLILFGFVNGYAVIDAVCIR